MSRLPQPIALALHQPGDDRPVSFPECVWWAYPHDRPAGFAESLSAAVGPIAGPAVEDLPGYLDAQAGLYLAAGGPLADFAAAMMADAAGAARCLGAATPGELQSALASHESAIARRAAR